MSMYITTNLIISFKIKGRMRQEEVIMHRTSSFIFKEIVFNSTWNYGLAFWKFRVKMIHRD